VYDSCLADHFSDILDSLERTCTPNLYDSFRSVSDELWRVLLQKKFRGYPRIKSILPDWPDEQLQRDWVGNTGEPLDLQSYGFIRNLKWAYSRFGATPLAQSTVLDFGVGWGRLIRYLAKDIRPERLWGCDVNSKVLQVCRETRVPGMLRECSVRPTTLPFEGGIDLVYAFSVLTHLSERTHRDVLECIHRMMKPGGILVLTVRPRAFLPLMGLDQSAYDSGYLFKPHNLPPDDGDIPYGDAVISDRYIRANWTAAFEIVENWWLMEDNMQVSYVLKKR
jgi:SAM-dependent methyltransferase